MFWRFILFELRATIKGNYKESKHVFFWSIDHWSTRERNRWWEWEINDDWMSTLKALLDDLNRRRNKIQLKDEENPFLDYTNLIQFESAE